MFIENSKPFDFKYYNKPITKPNNRVDLILSYNCINDSSLMYACSKFEDSTIAIKSNEDSSISINNDKYESKQLDLDIKEFFDDFTNSYILDFIIFKKSWAYFISRENDNLFSIFACISSSKCLEIFADPTSILDKMDEEVVQSKDIFDISLLNQKNNINAKEIEKNCVIDVELSENSNEKKPTTKIILSFIKDNKILSTEYSCNEKDQTKFSEILKAFKKNNNYSIIQILSKVNLLAVKKNDEVHYYCECKNVKSGFKAIELLEELSKLL